MEKTTIDSLGWFVGKEVTLEGWLYNSRGSGKVQFLIIRDGTGLCQCIVEKGKVSDELFEGLKHLGQESSLAVTGLVRAEAASRRIAAWDFQLPTLHAEMPIWRLISRARNLPAFFVDIPL